VTGPDRAKPGDEIEVKCELDLALKGEAVVTLEAKRGTALTPPKPVKGLSEDEALEVMAENWARANDWVVARKTLRVEGTSFSARLTVPGGSFVPGEYFLKVYVGREDPPRGKRGR
jgi:hypothetical protein